MEIDNIEVFKVQSTAKCEVPQSVYYIPDFISEDEEEYLINRVNDSSKIKWVYLTNRRLQNWGGHVHSKGLIKEPLPNWLRIYSEKVGKLGIFNAKNPNHVLVNEYLPGQGIMAHQDGPAFYPVVSTINLQSHTVLNFYRKTDLIEENAVIPPDYLVKKGMEKYVLRRREPSFSLLLQPRSLFIQMENVYSDYLHGIDGIDEDFIDSECIVNFKLCKSVKNDETLKRDTRISLTLRYVPNTISASFLIQKI